jgi:hypothetical protein
MEPKRYKLHEASPGKRVVMNSLADATIYTIKEVKNYGVFLVTFEHGMETSGQWVDISICSHPTEHQLNMELIK